MLNLAWLLLIMIKGTALKLFPYDLNYDIMFEYSDN